MKRLSFALLAILSLGANFLVAEAPAQACTPHPDNPDGCNNWPPRRINVEDLKLNKPLPGPVCLSCPSYKIPRDQLIQKDLLVGPSSQPGGAIQTLDQSINRDRFQY